MTITRFLTGITPSGTPHLGNFVGSIRPSVAASRNPEVQSFYFWRTITRSSSARSRRA